MLKKTDKTVKIFDLFFFGRTKGDLLNWWQKLLEKKRMTLLVVTPNPEQIVQMKRDVEFRKVLQRADVCLPDGIGIVWASKLLLKKPLKQRLAGREIVADLLQIANRKQYRVLVIGGQNYDHFCQVEKRSGNGWQLLRCQKFSFFWHRGFDNIRRPGRLEEKKIIKTIAEVRPDMVFVAFGAPWQEKWLVGKKQWWRKFRVSLVMAVGGSFDVLVGKVKASPNWISKLGLEWLYRLGRQPWRWRRQLRLLSFGHLVVKLKVRQLLSSQLEN